MPEKIPSPLEYICKLYAPQDDLLAEIEASLLAIDMAMHVGAEVGKLLQLLIKLHNVKTIVEIGTLAGYSAIWMARALPADGHLYTINKDPAHIKMAKAFFAKCEVQSRITMLEGDALQTLPTGSFDMVFIDADKISYLHYLDWAEKNIRPGGLIVADNTLLGGAVYQELPQPRIRPTTWHNMRAFNERLADPAKYCSVMIPTQEGLTMAIKL